MNVIDEVCWAGLEQVVRFRDVLEGGVKTTTFFRAATVGGADPVGVDELITHRRDDVSLRDHDTRTGHRRRLVRRRARLHYLLKMRRQVDQGTARSDFSLVCIDLELNVADATGRKASILRLLLVRKFAHFIRDRVGNRFLSNRNLGLLVEMTLHNLLPLAHLLIKLVSTVLVGCGG